MKIIKDIKGTASELKENRAYDMLVERVGEAGATHSIQTKLQERGLTIKQWNNYRQVRRVMHSNPLGVSETLSDVDSLTNTILG